MARMPIAFTDVDCQAWSERLSGNIPTIVGRYMQRHLARDVGSAIIAFAIDAAVIDEIGPSADFRLSALGFPGRQASTPVPPP